MRKFRILALMFSLMLVAAACSESTGSTTTAAAVDTTAAIEDAAHETGEEADHDESEEAPTDEVEEPAEAAHDDAEEAHEEDAHDDTGMDMDMDMSGAMSADYIPEAAGDVTSEYTIILSEFGFDPSELDLTPGETVRFILINEGALLHEFRLTTEHKAEEHLAAGHDDHGNEADETEESHEDPDILVNVAGGATRTVEMTLPTDAIDIDQMACLIPGHYESGMFAGIDF